MTENGARDWIAARYSAAAMQRLERFRALLVEENYRQNLVASSTLPAIWVRHLLDSAQLIDLAPSGWQHWVDIGSGGGLPGVVVAALTGLKVTLVEPRRLRVDFLQRCGEALDLPKLAVVQAKVEAVDIAGTVDVISARAVATLDRLFAASAHFGSNATYILPKGQIAKLEVAAAQRSWQGVFHVEQSIVDPASGIVVATGIARR